MMTTNPRRRLLKAFFLASGLALFSTASADTTNLDYSNSIKYWETLQAEQLESLVGQSFSVYGDNISCVVSLESVHVTEDPTRPAELVRRSSFSAKLVPIGYDCQKSDHLAYVSHPEIIGDGQLFVMAKSDEKDNWYLEIVFN